MSSIPFLKGTRVYLRALVESDAEGDYPTWFNDSEVCEGNMHHVFPYSVEDALNYIQQANIGRQHFIQAIVLNSDNLHIGNIALDKINYINRTAELTIIIGNKKYWGKGIAKEAAQLICDHGFFVLNLNRINCGTFEHNIGMRKLAEYLAMSEEGRRRQAVFKNGRYVDIIEYGVLRREYVESFRLDKQ